MKHDTSSALDERPPRALAVNAALWALRGVSYLPASVRHLLGDGLALVAPLLLRRRLAIAARNLELCFSDYSPTRRRALLRGHLRELGRGLLDLFWLRHIDKEELRRRVIVQGMEELQRADGRGVILLAAHFRTMHIGGIRIASDCDIGVVYQKQHNLLAHRFITDLQGRFIQEKLLFPRDEFILPVCRFLRRGGILYYLPDMDLNGRDRPVFVPFLGVPEVSTGTALQRLVTLGRARVVPCVTRPLEGGRYLVRLYPAWKDFPGPDPRAAARRVNRFIEDQVRETPEQYYWMHRRFKTRPPGAAPLYP